MSFVSSRGGATCRGTGQFLNISAGNQPFPPFPTPTPGNLYVFGVNSDGECGVGNNNPIPSLTQVGTANNWLTGARSSPSGGGQYNIMIKTDGTMYSTGLNNFYQLGLGNTTNVNSFTQIGSANNWAWCSKGSASEGAFAITTTGDLYSWGYNYYGSLGQSNLTVANTTTWQSTTRANITTPTFVTSNVLQVVQGSEFTAILKNDGTIWTCGFNQVGQLARNLPTNYDNVYPSFQQESTLKNNWKYIGASDDQLLAIDNNGILYYAGADWYSGTPYKTTLTTSGLPTQTMGGISYISGAGGSFASIDTSNNIIYFGQDNYNPGFPFTSLTWAGTGYTGKNVQATGAILNLSNNIILTSSLNNAYPLPNTISFQSFDYKGGIPDGTGNGYSSVNWFIGN